MAKIKWHIEPTSKCVLECPMCDRTWFHKKFKRRLNHDINIDHIIKFLDGTYPKVKMCGNNGDPIYHSQFHRLCSELKKIDATISITTNGSGKKKPWWQKLCSILTQNDSIEFSIDGLEHTNHLYRKNARWESIMNAISIVTPHKIQTTWKFIVFKHNQHQIEDARKLSQSLGIDNFKLIRSERWWNKEMMPDKEFVDPLYAHQIEVINDTDKESVIRQKCMTKQNGQPDKNLYIDSEGNFYPCCYQGLLTFRYKNIFSPKAPNKGYNIANHTIKQILGKTEVNEFFDSTKSYSSADRCCKIYCGVPKTMIEKNSKL